MDVISRIREAFDHALLVSLFQPIFDKAGNLSVAQLAHIACVDKDHFTRCISCDRSKPPGQEYEVRAGAGTLRLRSFVNLGCYFGVCYPTEWSIWAIRAYQAAYQQATAAAPPQFRRSDAVPTMREILVLHRWYRLLPKPLFASQPRAKLGGVAVEVNTLINTLLWGSADEPDEMIRAELGKCDVKVEEIRSIGQEYLDCWHLVEEACGYDWFRLD